MQIINIVCMGVSMQTSAFDQPVIKRIQKMSMRITPTQKQELALVKIDYRVDLRESAQRFTEPIILSPSVRRPLKSNPPKTTVPP